MGGGNENIAGDAVNDILGFLDPGCDSRLERIKVLKKCLEFGFVRVPAVELLLVICPALLRSGVGIVEPVKGSLDLRLHLFKGGIFYCISLYN